MQNFYPRPPRGGRRGTGTADADLSGISIHALREEGDSCRTATGHMLHEFLSTPSARRATSSRCFPLPALVNFYPRPPRGGRPAVILVGSRMEPISIHALREEGDLLQGFQHPHIPISIHALREEGDPKPCATPAPTNDFYPRPPRGGRHHRTTHFAHRSEFLSTPSARRATSPAPSTRPRRDISIHALREEGDSPTPRALPGKVEFLSTPSARRATPGIRGRPKLWGNFYPRPPRGGRPRNPWTAKTVGKFLSTPSARRATAKTETKSLFSNKLYNILHEFRRALIYNGSKSYPNHAK